LFTYRCETPKTAATSSEEKLWTLGGGFEFGLAPNWSLKAEYMYFDFADEPFASPYRTNGTLYYKLSETLSTAKVGFNYRFGSDKAPVAAKY